MAKLFQQETDTRSVCFGSNADVRMPTVRPVKFSHDQPKSVDWLLPNDGVRPDADIEGQWQASGAQST